jgi:predicted transcriptional regulator
MQMALIRVRSPICAPGEKALAGQPRDNLPANATVEEATERLLFLAKTEQGIAEADAGKTLSHEEVRKRLGL